MPISRRQFLKVFAGTGVAVTVSGNLIPEIVSALEKAVAGNPPVLWIQGGGCTGCSVLIIEHGTSEYCGGSSKNHQPEVSSYCDGRIRRKSLGSLIQDG